MSTWTKRERLEATIRGEATDRPPASRGFLRAAAFLGSWYWGRTASRLTAFEPFFTGLRIAT